jgi:isoleucyl-tRNA synthetase
MSPILCFTAAEAWSVLHRLGEGGSIDEEIHFVEFSPSKQFSLDQTLMEKWSQLIRVRSEITKALELARRDKVIGHPLEAEVSLVAGDELMGFLGTSWEIIREISIVSELSVLGEAAASSAVRFESEELPGLIVQVQAAKGEKCERCWIRSTTVGADALHPLLCQRCAGVMAELSSKEG